MQGEKVIIYSGLLNNATVTTAVCLPLISDAYSRILLSQIQ